jgi:hypothetical protein
LKIRLPVHKRVPSAGRQDHPEPGQ